VLVLYRKNRRGDSDDEGDNDSDEEEVEVTTKDDLRELANFERAARLQKVQGMCSVVLSLCVCMYVYVCVCMCMYVYVCM
jgi:hypothetical protein